MARFAPPVAIGRCNIGAGWLLIQFMLSFQSVPPIDAHGITSDPMCNCPPALAEKTTGAMETQSQGRR